MGILKFAIESPSAPLFKVAAVLTVALIGAVVFSNTASASMATNSRLSYGNAWNYCQSTHTAGQPGPYAKGMVWIANDETDYYSESVTIASNTNSARVSIRGAVNGCYTAWSGNRDIYAVDITTSYLSAMSSSTLYRGRIIAPGAWSWTSEGSKLYGNLDVSNVARCTPASLSTGSVVQTVIISISRRQQQYNMSGQLTYDSPTVGTENVPITVTRTCPTYDYNLQPSINLTDGTGAQTPQSRTVEGFVAKSGATASKPDTPWRISMLVYSPTATINKNGGTTAGSVGPCTFFTGEASCDDTSVNGIRASPYTAASTTESGTFNISSYDVGTRICFALSVRNYNQTTDGWRHSDLRCLIAGKKPKVDVLGGDLYVGRTMAGITSSSSGRVITSSTSNALGLFGSWSEYGIVSKGPVTEMSSGSGYAGGYTGSTASSLNLLTFANSGNSAASCGGTLGCYQQPGPFPDVANRFKTSSESPTFNSGSLTSRGKGIYIGSGTIYIDQSTIQEGKSIVINAPTANVVIRGNISYQPGPYSSLAQIPQVVIIANNITIQAGVENVDAWLIAPGTNNAGVVSGGVIRTCDVNTASISISVCSNPLTINGPVVANRLIMLRTGGSEPNARAGDPAEVFNLRSDAYLWALGQGEVGGRVTTVSTKELPPRY